MEVLKRLSGTSEGGAFRPGLALRRLMYVAAIGSLIIIVYALRYARTDALAVLSIASVGLMAGGAALVSGGLLGFLFGVPRTREDTSPRGDDAVDQRGASGDSSSTYRPNTSLEQIADWLTKILVGVGLVQIRQMPEKLRGIAEYVARGLGPGEGSETFALAIFVHFSVCGFVFGFLWARIYFPRWFREADQIQMLEEKVTELEKRQRADARALALADTQLNRNPDDPAVTDDEIANAIKEASKPVRIQIFRQAETASRNTSANDFNLKLEGAISIFQGLIKSESDQQYHRNYSELAHALLRKKPRDWQRAENAFSKAIEIRDKMEVKGWKSYEFYRARCRMGMDADYNNRRPSSDAVKAAIVKDLSVPAKDTEKWKRWSDPANSEAAKAIQDWRSLNQVTDAVLAGSAIPKGNP
jgi:hypothetical protein